MLSVVATKKLVLSAAMAVLMHVNVAWCDSCGEMHPADELADGTCIECVEHTVPCRVCGEATAEDSLFDGYCPDCWDIAEDGGYCDCCGELLAGSDEFVVCDCHGIHGPVCRECAEWHEDFE